RTLDSTIRERIGLTALGDSPGGHLRSWRPSVVEGFQNGTLAVVSYTWSRKVPLPPCACRRLDRWAHFGGHPSGRRSGGVSLWCIGTYSLGGHGEDHRR